MDNEMKTAEDRIMGKELSDYFNITKSESESGNVVLSAIPKDIPEGQQAEYEKELWAMLSSSRFLKE